MQYGTNKTITKKTNTNKNTKQHKDTEYFQLLNPFNPGSNNPIPSIKKWEKLSHPNIASK